MDLTKELNELKEKVTPLNTLKFLAGTVVSCWAMAAIAAALKIPLQSSRGLTKLIMKLGVFILACKAGDIAETYFNDTVDSIIKTFNEAKEEMADESDSK